MKPSEMLRDENFECDEEMLDMVAKEVEQLEAKLEKSHQANVEFASLNSE